LEKRRVPATAGARLFLCSQKTSFLREAPLLLEKRRVPATAGARLFLCSQKTSFLREAPLPLRAG